MIFLVIIYHVEDTNHVQGFIIHVFLCIFVLRLHFTFVTANIFCGFKCKILRLYFTFLLQKKSKKSHLATLQCSNLGRHWLLIGIKTNVSKTKRRNLKLWVPINNRLNFSAFSPMLIVSEKRHCLTYALCNMLWKKIDAPISRPIFFVTFLRSKYIQMRHYQAGLSQKNSRTILVWSLGYTHLTWPVFFVEAFLPLYCNTE